MMGRSEIYFISGGRRKIILLGFSLALATPPDEG
jgi:hypothetical protein